MHNGIEVRIEIDGKPIMVSNSALLHGYLKFASPYESRDLLDAVNTHNQKVSVIIKAVTLPDAEVDAPDCGEAADVAPAPARQWAEELPAGQIAVQRFSPEALAAMRAEVREVFAMLSEDDEPSRRTNAAHWWDRPELVNWEYRQSGSQMYGLMLVHLPCGHPEYRIESLTESISRAAGHRCKRDQPPATDGETPVGVVSFIADRALRADRG